MIYAGDWQPDSGAYYTLTGVAVPDPQGDYMLMGFINFEPWFRHVDGTFEIWLDIPTTKWRCAVNMGDSANGYWYAPTHRHGPYIQGLNYTGTFGLQYYRPTGFMPSATVVNQKGGGSSARYRRVQRIPPRAPRGALLHWSMKSVAEYWATEMPPNLQAEWLNNAHIFDNQNNIEYFNRPYLRFYNVNIVLEQAGLPWIIDHTGRTHYFLHDFAVVATHIGDQLLTTSTEIYRTWDHPCFTLYLYYQCMPLSVPSRMAGRYTRLLGTFEAWTDAEFPDTQQFIHDWDAAYPLVVGEKTQILLRYVHDYDHGEWPNNWCPFTLTQLSNVYDIPPD